jgi:hypothetical protein
MKVIGLVAKPSYSDALFGNIMCETPKRIELLLSSFGRGMIYNAPFLKRFN